MDTVSVIVPNYNSGKCLKKCLEMLLQQTYKISEIIIVDDSSDDESKMIAKEYATLKDNIVLIENETNKGVSYARNIGIKNAKSDYIIFCDSDDWYERDAVAKLIKAAKENNAEYVFSGHYITYDDNKKVEIKYANFKNSPISKEQIIAYLPISSCAKLIKKTLFLDNKIEYMEGIKNCEELSVIPIAAFYANKVVYIDECLYNYYQRKGSASNKKLLDLSFYDITFNEFVKKLPKEYSDSINIRMAEHLLYSKIYTLIKEKRPKEEIEKNIDICKLEIKKENVKKILKNLPLRKRIFLICALSKKISILKMYIYIQQKLINI